MKENGKKDGKNNFINLLNKFVPKIKGLEGTLGPTLFGALKKKDHNSKTKQKIFYEG